MGGGLGGWRLYLQCIDLALGFLSLGEERLMRARPDE